MIRIHHNPPGETGLQQTDSATVAGNPLASDTHIGSGEMRRVGSDQPGNPALHDLPRVRAKPEVTAGAAVLKLTLENREAVTLRSGQGLAIELPRNTTVGSHYWDFNSGLPEPTCTKVNPGGSAAAAPAGKVFAVATGSDTVVESFTWPSEEIDQMVEALGQKNFTIQASLMAEDGNALRGFTWHVAVE